MATLLPLLILTLTFEIVFALHTGVERVGRYLQVFFEDDATDRGWEHQAMAFGQQFPGGGLDPLFTACFWAAIVLNLIPVATACPRPLSGRSWAPCTPSSAFVFLSRVAAPRFSAPSTWNGFARSN